MRALHYQTENTQGKLVRVISGVVFDVAMDMRESSLTFGQWAGEILYVENKRQLWVPEGFAHGFYVLQLQMMRSLPINARIIIIQKQNIH